ncbi:phosphatidylglycerol lysyltransferase domain-containing protein [Actinoplanes sp. NPDC049265]|uniref:phosphatidylglycerol lysyltransferase domain-containing protein n=1 Tax=Actinoplanes sp. NPDC049265 TaxID=3363902 RepID=UPI00372487FE
MSEPDLAPSWRSRPPLSQAAISRMTQLAGLFDLLSVLVPPHRWRVEALAEFLPTAGIVSARAAIAVAGVLLIYLGAGLRRGKHRAWQVAVGVAAAGVVLHLAKGLDLGAAVVSLALLSTLIATRHRFHARADRRSRWRALGALLGFGWAGFLLGFVEIAIRQNRLIGSPGIGAWAEHAALGLIGVDGPVHFAYPIGGEAVSLTTGAFGLMAAAAAVVLLLRPGSRRPGRTAVADRRLRALLEHDEDSLGYFALREDKSLIWAPSGAAVIAYRVINGVSLAAGDPIGPESAWPEAIGAWLADCRAYGWTPAVLGCGNAAGRAYRKRGLDVIELGDEAVLDTDAFALDGRAMRGVRQAVNRARRAGYRVEAARQRDLAPAVLAGVRHAADQFRDGSVERGFSMALSRLGDPRDGDCVMVIARDGDDRIRGVLQFVPWGSDGLSLDLMRGDRTAGNGLTELMVTGAVDAARELGVRRLSLNFAVLRSVFARAEELGAGPGVRVLARTLRSASRLWQIESLYRANAKYQPRWQPRYLCFPVARDLPRIAVAALSAELWSGVRIEPIAGPADGADGVPAERAVDLVP